MTPGWARENREPDVTIVKILASSLSEEEVELNKIILGCNVNLAFDLTIVFFNSQPTVTDEDEFLVSLHITDLKIDVQLRSAGSKFPG